jgi:pimeloyl-ACP methyl ester carboxylesterase
MPNLAIYLNNASIAHPLVLLPPFPLDSQAWDAVLTRLDGCAITVDPPGFGGSPLLEEASLRAYARALLASLDSAGVDTFAIAGNSMGGYTAMAIAEIAPERLTGIGLIGTKATADDPAARANRGDMIDRANAGASAFELVGPMVDKLLSENAKHRQPGAVTQLEGWLASAPPAGIAWAQRAMSGRPDRLAVLQSLDIPAVVMHGKHDVLMSQADMQKLADALGVELQVVDSGHAPPLEVPDVVAEALRQFL